MITIDFDESTFTSKKDANTLQAYINKAEDALEILKDIEETFDTEFRFKNASKPIPGTNIQALILSNINNVSKKYIKLTIITYSGTIPETPILIYSARQIEECISFLEEKIKNAYYFLNKLK